MASEKLPQGLEHSPHSLADTCLSMLMVDICDHAVSRQAARTMGTEVGRLSRVENPLSLCQPQSPGTCGLPLGQVMDPPRVRGHPPIQCLQWAHDSSVGTGVTTVTAGCSLRAQTLEPTQSLPNVTPAKGALGRPQRDAALPLPLLLLVRPVGTTSREPRG